MAVSSFWIHQIRLVGPWSPIHLLSIFTLIVLPLGVWLAHRHRVADHRRIDDLIFAGALVVAGLFTFVPGRIMHAVVFGLARERRRRFVGGSEPGPAPGREPSRARKSLKKRREKQLSGEPFRVVKSAPIRYMIPS